MKRILELKDKFRDFIKADNKITYLGKLLGEYNKSIRDSKLLGFVLTVVSLVQLILKEKITRKGADLTYSTIMSIVPILAIIFAIAKGFGMEGMMWNQIEKLMGVSETDIMDQVLMSVSKSVEMTKANSGWIFGVAVFILLYTANNAMCKLEDIFNEIWNVRSGKGWFERLPYNMFFLVVLPSAILMIGAITGQVESLASSYISFADWGMRCLIVSIMLVAIYKLLPDTNVKFLCALYAGIIAGIALTVWHYCYLEFQNTLFNYNKVYGSFAAIPFFLIWTLISWIICLIGAKLSMVLQMRTIVKGWSVLDQMLLEEMSERSKMHVLVSVASVIARNFVDGQQTTEHILVEKTKLSYIYVSYGVEVLVKCGFIHVVLQGKNELVYPTKNVENMTVAEFVKCVFVSGHDNLTTTSDEVKNCVDELFIDATRNNTKKLKDVIS